MPLESIEFATIDYDEILQYAKKLDSIFQYNESIDRTAYLNWRTRFALSERKQFVVIGEAYFSTAYNLVQQCAEDNSDKKSDSWIFPIMFNIIHGIEVYLKAINVALCTVLGKERKITEGGHDIRELCATAKNLIIEYKPKNKNGTTEQMFTAIKLIEKFIANIYEKTDDMTFARYPMAKDKNDHFYIQNLENEVIDIDLLKEQMVFVYKMLEFIYDMPELEMEIKAEVMNDYY